MAVYKYKKFTLSIESDGAIVVNLGDSLSVTVHGVYEIQNATNIGISAPDSM